MAPANRMEARICLLAKAMSSASSAGSVAARGVRHAAWASALAALLPVPASSASCNSCTSPLAGLVTASFTSKSQQRSEASGPSVAGLQSGSEERRAETSSRAGAETGAWNYFTEMDEETGREISYAVVIAKERLFFEYPLHAGAEAHLVLRKHPILGTSVFLWIEKGHFNCSDVGGCRITASFDGGNSVTFRAGKPEDESSYILFITPRTEFISALKNSKLTRIEAPFFQKGSIVMTFETANLRFEGP